jgi:hypothetical protein
MKKIKLESVFAGMLILLGGIHSTYSISGASTSDPCPAFTIPIYQGGYNVIKKFNSAEGSQTVNYRIQLKPPAAELIEFYDSYFNGAGWISSFEICQRHWDDYADHQSLDVTPLKQMYASWEHPQLDFKIVMWLRYIPTEKQARNVVKVECRLQKKNGG